MDTIVSLKLPPKKYRRTIEELSVVIPDPALKLKFLKQAINEHQKISAPYKLYPPLAGIAFRKRLLNNAENICPGSKKAAKKLIRTGKFDMILICPDTGQGFYPQMLNCFWEFVF